MSEVVVRAGICEFNESSKLCNPLPVQGSIKMAPHEEGIELGFWSFEWSPVEKTAKPMEPISLILIPGETKCVRLSSKNGRVFSLVFSSDQKYFFWLQEKNAGSLKLDQFSENDLKFLEKLDSILKGPEEEEEEEAEDLTEKLKHEDVEMKD